MHTLDGLRILVVEDFADLRSVIVEELQKANALVMEAASGNEALRLCLNYDFDLIYSDVEMPNGDGKWLLSCLRDKGIKTKFVYTSGGIHMDTHLAQKLGAIGYFAKPVNPKELIEFLRKEFVDASA